MTLQVVDRFTTIDGEWYESSKPYSITKEMADKYFLPKELGGAHHIYVKAKPGTQVIFATMDPTSPQSASYTVPEFGWTNHPMFESSSYKPDKGEVGPWFVRINGVTMAVGVGRPNGWHVSTFLVVEDTQGPPQPQPGKDKYQVVKNGVVVASWED